ncbi:hypothetical protein QR685DRAFT_573568 [Neurospora intermedia]|uniref:Uncharacterized protein n=1 Tax=Neurospora intermedia TaxID=5142 RepID=A0ABR3D7M9_NEUIN
MEEKRCIVTPAALFDRWYKCRLQDHTLIRTKSECCVVLCYVFCVLPQSSTMFTHAGFTLELCEAAVCFLDDRATTCPSFRYNIFSLETVMYQSRQIAFSTNFDKREDRYYWNDPPPVSHRAGAIKVHSSHPQTRKIGRVQMVIEKEKRAGEIPFDRRIPLEETIRLRCGKWESDEKEWIPVRAKSDNHYLFGQDAVTPSGPASVATVLQGQEHTTSRRELTRFTSEQRLSRAPIYRLRRLFDVVVNRASNGDQHRNRRHHLETMKCECNACDGPLAAPSCFIDCNQPWTGINPLNPYGRSGHPPIFNRGRRHSPVVNDRAAPLRYLKTYSQTPCSDNPQYEQPPLLQQPL